MPEKKKVRPPKSDVLYEIMDSLAQQKSDIEWLLENISDSGKPLSIRHKQIIKGSLMNTLRDHADEGLFQFCFGDAEYALKSINNLITRMHRYEEIIS